MAQNTSPDDQYLRSREDLLPYEDARMNSLLQGIANFYTTRNDQSTWGNFLRSLAIELGKLDYSYSYAIVNKEPSFLTPPDISRRWRDPLYVTSNWPSKTQFDTDFKLMLVELITAYKMGATVEAIQDVIFAYTGITIIVEELYKQIGNGVFDQSDRNAIKVSVAVGNDSLSQITTLTQLQQVVQSLYGAIDLAKPAHVGLEFTTIFGEGDDIDCFISPTFLTAEQFLSLTPNQQSIYTLTAYVLADPPIFWLASTLTSNPYDQGTLLKDSNGNLQLAITAGKPGLELVLTSVANASAGSTVYTGVITGGAANALAGKTFTVGGFPSLVNNGSFLCTASTATTLTLANASGVAEASSVALATPIPIWNQTSNGTTLDNQITWKNISPQPSNISLTSNVLTVTVSNIFTPGTQVKLLNLSGAFAFLNGIKLSVLTANNSSFTAAFTHGDVASTPQTQGTVSFVPAPQINLLAYLQLSSTYQGLYQAQYTNTNCTSTGINDTLRIFIRQIEQPPFNPMLIQAPVLDASNPTTTIAARGEFPPVVLQASSGPVNSPATTGYNGLPAITFTVTNTVSDGVNAGYTFTTLSAPGNLPLHEGMRVSIRGTTNGGGAFNITGKIRNVTMITMTSGMFQVPLTGTAHSSQAESGSGTVTPTLKSAYALQAGQYVLLQQQPAQGNPPALDPEPAELNQPNKWVFITNVDNGGNIYYTGEVGNWDVTHPMGLVAPRLDSCWEISGGDEDFIFGLT